MLDVKNDRVPHVGDRYAVADRRRAEILARQQGTEQEILIYVIGQVHDVDDRLEYALLVGTRDAVVDAARIERLGKRRQLAARFEGLIEYLV